MELDSVVEGFFRAAEHGRSDVLKALIEHTNGTIKLNEICDGMTGETPLHIAVMNNKTDALRVLLAAGFPAEIKAKKNQLTAYELAKDREKQYPQLVFVFHQFIIQKIALNDVQSVEKLLKAGIPVGISDDSADNSLIHWATSCQAHDVLSYLLQLPEVKTIKLYDRKNRDGAVPLHVACRGNYKKCVELLLHSGADSNLTGQNGYSENKLPKDLTSDEEILSLFKNENLDQKQPSTDNVLEENKKKASASNRNSSINRINSRDRHELEEKDILIQQLKSTIEGLVIESQEIQKLGEERCVLDYIRKLREEKELAARQLEDAEEFIKMQQKQLNQLKLQLRKFTHIIQNANISVEEMNKVDLQFESTLNKSEIPPDHIELSNNGRETQDTNMQRRNNHENGAKNMLQSDENIVDNSSIWDIFWPADSNGKDMEEDIDGEVVMTV